MPVHINCFKFSIGQELVHDITLQAIVLECRATGNVDLQCFYFHSRNHSKGVCRLKNGKYDEELLKLSSLDQCPQFNEMKDIMYAKDLPADKLEYRTQLWEDSEALGKAVGKIRSSVSKQGWSAYRSAILHIYMCYLCVQRRNFGAALPSPFCDQLSLLSPRDVSVCDEHLTKLPHFANNLCQANQDDMLRLLGGAAQYDSNKGAVVKLLDDTPSNGEVSRYFGRLRKERATVNSNKPTDPPTQTRTKVSSKPPNQLNKRKLAADTPKADTVKRQKVELGENQYWADSDEKQAPAPGVVLSQSNDAVAPQKNNVKNLDSIEVIKPTTEILCDNSISSSAVSKKATSAETQEEGDTFESNFLQNSIAIFRLVQSDFSAKLKNDSSFGVTDGLSAADIGRVYTPNVWVSSGSINYLAELLNTHEADLFEYTSTDDAPNYFYPVDILVKVVPDGVNYKYEDTHNVIRNPCNPFKRSKLFFPVNHFSGKRSVTGPSGCHWSLIVVDVKQKIVTSYDSLGYPGTVYMQATVSYIHDYAVRRKFLSEKTATISRTGPWKFVTNPVCPKQNNGEDCGMFTMVNMLFLADSLPLTDYDWTDICFFRQYITYCLCNRLVYDPRIAPLRSRVQSAPVSVGDPSIEGSHSGNAVNLQSPERSVNAKHTARSDESHAKQVVQSSVPSNYKQSVLELCSAIANIDAKPISQSDKTVSIGLNELNQLHLKLSMYNKFLKECNL